MEAPKLIPQWLDECALTSPDVARIAEEYLGSSKTDWQRKRLTDQLVGLCDLGTIERLGSMTPAALMTVCLHITGSPSLTEVVCGSPLCLGSGHVLDLDPSPVCGFCHGKGVVKPTTAQVVRADQIGTETAHVRLWGVAPVAA